MGDTLRTYLEAAYHQEKTFTWLSDKLKCNMLTKGNLWTSTEINASRCDVPFTKKAKYVLQPGHLEPRLLVCGKNMFLFTKDQFPTWTF